MPNNFYIMPFLLRLSIMVVPTLSMMRLGWGMIVPTERAGRVTAQTTQGDGEKVSKVCHSYNLGSGPSTTIPT